MKDYRKLYKKHYGIDFDSNYVVHHIDGNRENNDISNLLLLPRGLHSKYHGIIGLVKYSEKNSHIDLTEFMTNFDWLMKVSAFSMSYNMLMDVLPDVGYWIERKHRADTEYEGGYFEFRIDE